MVRECGDVEKEESRSKCWRPEQKDPQPLEGASPLLSVPRSSNRSIHRSPLFHCRDASNLPTSAHLQGPRRGRLLGPHDGYIYFCKLLIGRPWYIPSLLCTVSLRDAENHGSESALGETKFLSWMPNSDYYLQKSSEGVGWRLCWLTHHPSHSHMFSSNCYTVWIEFYWR